jgi:hypothetical protein
MFVFSTYNFLSHFQALLSTSGVQKHFLGKVLSKMFYKTNEKNSISPLDLICFIAFLGVTLHGVQKHHSNICQKNHQKSPKNTHPPT